MLKKLKPNFGAQTEHILFFDSYRPLDLIGNSEKIMELKRKIEKIAKSHLPVLILGESGSGKSHVARLIHELSVRNMRCFFDENISALADSIVESELFGSVEGAFTDSRNRCGCFEIADGGTLFLDEIGEASLQIQKKLLKVIETGEFRKVGSSQIQKTDVRLIFATNADLYGKIQSGEFREDLFYRMANLVIRIPSLRERKDDIPELCQEYLLRKNYLKSFSESALEELCGFDWPGNVRQLHSTIERAVFNSDDSGLILPEHIEIY
ncbi:MAG: sigma-54-dependent Fis family transcriptional regulator [Treponema sp.]|nr:sigma-54-dependent Fis family transcriptional regulator [Treponema sp.]MBR4628854.1 sigma-54-dependent Fis family transcriptional regulator [Treponema sp.]MBR6912303.1 sigma-54-dependent Fis family transcriptional regulator [Treponema sp.]